ncbi:MAG: type II toxin-antitoxin system RelB/DinJ family antitoxin [Oscillospiraceae bacterium]|jgi:DNA-damage-inducible protein J|nr:type II toxin-antitoxin system RelB/DinJ family antitoxin [Oscillospiraceae bacterium]
MAQTKFSVTMDSGIKQRLDEFCASVGLTATVAFNLFAHALLRENRLPFEVKPKLSEREEYFARLRRGMEELNQGKGVEHDIIEVDE